MHGRAGLAVVGVGAALLSIGQAAHGVEISPADFGALPDGHPVELISLTNGHGLVLRVMTLGASVQSLLVPDRNGKVADVALGYANLAGYLSKPQYFGAT